MNIQKSSFPSIEQLQDQYLSQGRKPEKQTDGNVSFREILENQENLKFSKHASGRMKSRNITLTQSQQQRLQDGMIKAGQKGIQESLVVVDELAFIVNIPNKTVITAMDRADTKDNVFTNIDGAVFM